MSTLKDVARISGVSTATASYVINNGPRPVSVDARRRVLKAIEELNYRPSAAARGLKGKSTDTIGVIFPHQIDSLLENDYFAPVMAGVLDAASSQHKSLMLYTGLNWDEADTNYDVYADGRCDGLILIAPPVKGALIHSVVERGMEVVVIGTHVDRAPSSSVDADNEEGARIGTRHLLELGHRRIAMLQATETASSGTERTAGFRRAHAEFGLTVPDDRIVLTSYDAAIAGPVIHRLLSEPEDKRPTAIFASDDFLAHIAAEYAKANGINVPRDLSLVGFNDVASAASADPPLTTVRQPLREIGAAALHLLVEHIRRDSMRPVTKILGVSLIVRETTAPPRVV